MSTRTITNRAFAIAIATMLACLCALAFAAPGKAHAAQLAAGEIATQSGTNNTTMYYAQRLKSGKGVIGTFESKDDSNTNLYQYWYKFKTSSRWSAYSVKIESIDGRYVQCLPYTENGDDDTESWGMWYTGNNSTTNAATNYNAEPKRNSWYYFEVSQNYSWGAALYYDNRALRYDQFKITVTEHPIIKNVTGVKVAKKAKKSITLKWNKQANATKYQIKWKKKGGSWKTATVAKNSKAFKGLQKNTKYQFKVRGYCKNGYDLVNKTSTNWTAWTTVKTVKTAK